MNYGYIRVSTDKQTVKNQKLAIKDYARTNRIHNIKWYAETITGTILKLTIFENSYNETMAYISAKGY